MFNTDLADLEVHKRHVCAVTPHPFPQITIPSIAAYLWQTSRQIPYQLPDFVRPQFHSSFVLRLPSLHVDFTTELMAGLYSGGASAVCDHPLGNSNQFHPDLRGFPRFRVYLGTSTDWLAKT